MQSDLFKRLAIISALLCLAPGAASAAPPAHDLTVELRQISEGQDDVDSASNGNGSYTVSTAPRAADFAPQQVRVRNGEKASLQLSQSMPMLWVQKIESQSATLSTPGAASAPGASASSAGAGMTQALTWMEAGQSLIATPHWPGGKQPAKIEIEVQSSAVDERTTSDLPATARQHFKSTVSAPLRQWITIATTGSAAKPGTYSSNGTSQGRRLLQIRVLAN
jgi:hypothetical protein